MGRLTKRNSDGSVGINDIRYYNYNDFQKIAQKLCHYEDLEEQGRLVEQSYSYVNTIVGKMGVMHQECSKCNEELEWKAYPPYCPNCGAKMFATKEEAEAKLAEKGGGSDE